MSRWFNTKLLRRRTETRRARFSLTNLETRLAPAVIGVTNNNDSGAGSLRQAIIDASMPDKPGMDQITFDPSVIGTITLASPLSITSDLTIVGLAPATTLSHSADANDRDAFIGSEDAEELAMSLFGRVDEETLARVTHGNGAMADYRRGKGAVFNAGSCEWVAGLIARDPAVEQVTRNVLTGDWG